MSFYEQDIRDAVRARAGMGQEIGAIQFGMHLAMMYGWDAEHSIRVMQRCVAEGVMWVGHNQPRRGRPDYVVLTGLGRRLAAEISPATS